MPLYQLAYVSRATEPQTDESLLEIQRGSLAHNRSIDVTGLLGHGKGRFMQFLEGPLQPLVVLFDKILDDERHHDVRCVLFRPADTRVYSEWSMIVFNLDSRVEEIDAAQLWRRLNDPGDGGAEHALRQVIDAFEGILGN